MSLVIDFLTLVFKSIQLKKLMNIKALIKAYIFSNSFQTTQGLFNKPFSSL